MKHILRLKEMSLKETIKLFETFHTIKIPDNVSIESYGNTIPLSKKEIDNLKSYFEKYDVGKKKNNEYFSDRDGKDIKSIIFELLNDDSGKNGGQYKNKYIDVDLGNVSIEIFKLDDEWFILKYWADYRSSAGHDCIRYKCDGYDGLIHLLDELLIHQPKGGEVNSKSIEILKQEKEKLMKNIIDYYNKQIETMDISDIRKIKKEYGFE